MRKKIVQIVSLLLVAAFLLPAAASAISNQYPSAGDAAIIRVGLYYNTTAQGGMNLLHHQGNGYQLGYYDSSRVFLPLASTTVEKISVTKTWNMYYGKTGSFPCYYTSAALTSDIAIGCYHVQMPGSYATYQEAAAAAGVQADGFVAYINGAYYARFGSYLSKSAAQSSVDRLGTGYSVGETSAYGINVVETGTTRILFQYDDQGKGNGLGVLPGSDSDAQAAVTWLQSGGSQNVYYGGFNFERISGGDLVVVNMIQLDDYVKGVIYREMSAAWNVEALKVQAVCARTYAIYHKERHKHDEWHFDLCTTVDCQVYDGVYISGTPEKIARVNQAVDETSGLIMTVNGAAIEALYSSSNGGASEDSGNVWGATTYLVGKADPYEQTIEIPDYKWSFTFTGKQLQSKLIANGYNNCGEIKKVQVTLTELGNVYSLTFIDSAGKSYTKYKNSCRTFLSLRSLRYTVSGDVSTTPLGEELVLVNGNDKLDVSGGVSVISGDGSISHIGEGYIITSAGLEPLSDNAQSAGSIASGSKFVFSGTGYGHNVGMSQFGAYAMSLLGYTYQEILHFYYTGVTIETC